MEEFSISTSQRERLKNWLYEQRILAVKDQQENIKPGHPWYNDCAIDWEIGHPYTGLTGAEETYCFTPNSIGTKLVVKYTPTENEIDLTDYENW